MKKALTITRWIQMQSKDTPEYRLHTSCTIEEAGLLQLLGIYASRRLDDELSSTVIMVKLCLGQLVLYICILLAEE